ncbi:MAG: elongation factor Ts [Patescibacteria group bacterium]
MTIDTKQVKDLRDRTGISVMQCKKALEEAGGDMDKALIILQKKSKAVAEKKSDRELKAGFIASYVHQTGAVGALLELSCETDFVAKNEEFKKLAYNIAMQVTASGPEYLKKEDVPKEVREKAAEVFVKEVLGKPENIKAKILEGKLDAYFADKILLEQSFIKDQDLKVSQLIEGAVQKFGEKIEVRRFVRFAI